MIKFKKAFTLAETLVVIGVIGIVATLVIPNLKDSSDEQVYVAKAKKAYAELETAYGRAILKYQDVPSWKGTIGKKVEQYLDAETTCTATESNCTGSILKDGTAMSFYYTAATDNTTAFYTITIDVDGSHKGYNSYGTDLFYASIPIGNELEAPSLRPYYNGYGSTSGSPDATYNSLNWIIKNGNQEYNNCSSVTWANPTCR